AYGEMGEICLAGPTVMIGYNGHDEENSKTLRNHPDGMRWVHTGDLGRMDKDGFIYFTQRLKRMIITNGYNVFPSQLENVIDAHEKVSMSCVIGIPDPIKQQRIKAFITLKPGIEPTQQVKDEVMEHVRKWVAKYSLPSEIEFRDDLPKTLVGKVAYRVLEEEELAKMS
ncbi:MAG: class I adenylate-forming enzyme family protein, partial [Candidatus Methanomethylophilaceae archaeon]|nr:class I adenylate-forming enzyme family protein [Candidatus Methanomethylophilaceae archaeon]